MDKRIKYKEENNHYKHGCSVNNKKTTEYSIWTGMKYRCNNPKDTQYHKYGARGIKVCERWLKDFTAFLSDMGYRPSLRHSLDRIDNDGDYSPENCRWATLEEQANNKRDTLWFTYNGETKCLMDWVKHFNVDYNLFKSRVTRGWDLERAAKQPTKKVISQ